MSHRVLLIDDEPIFRVTLADDLTREGYEVTSAADGTEGLSFIRERAFDVGLLDLKLPGVDGLTLLQHFKAANPAGLALMMTAYGTIQSAVTAMKAGAADYLVKPFRSDDLLLLLRGLLAPRAGLPATSPEPGGVQRLGEMVYASPKMAEVCTLIATVARSDATVLIQGETGTGKELAARAIHQAGDRHASPLVTVACAAIPESLLESELFGHEKGAFTGAFRERKGRFELADRGTLFLDEIADLSPAVQAKVLRVLQEREFERVGGSHTVKVNVRLISASRKRLEDEVLAGRLREDLFYRLKVITITLPALRERVEDVVPLAEHFLDKYRRPLGKQLRGLSDEARRHLLAHPWPGNVRELEASVQRAVTLTRNAVLEPDDFPLDAPAAWSDHPGGFSKSLVDVTREAERRYLMEVLRSVGGRRQRAAQLLGLSRKTLWKKLKLLGLE